MFRPPRHNQTRFGSVTPVLLAACIGVGLHAGPALAQASQSDEATQGGTLPARSSDAAADIWTRANLLGDIGGLRTTLGNYGINFGLQETSELLGDVSGGTKRGFDYDGLTTVTLGLDAQKAFGWDGGTFNLSALQIHGRNLSADHLDSLQTASGIEANRATRLWELWYQQAVLDGALDVKAGQQSLDQEFIVSQYSALFINTMAGWPMLPSADLYAGGPAYPLSSLGIRFKAKPTDALTVLGGVFDDNPPGGPFNNDLQVRGREATGTKFNLDTGALFIGEVQYAIDQPPAAGQEPGNQAAGMPGTYKLGMWYDTGSFPDQRFDNTGRSLADPSSSGVALMRRHNYSFYGVADQMIWHPAADAPQSLGVFARAMGAPGDRNLIEFSINAGISLKAPLPGRDNDSFGVGYGVAKVGANARGLDQDAAAFSPGTFSPVRSSETFVEVTYQFQITPWWQLQPDIQYIVSPGGGIGNPAAPGTRIGDELVLGVRTNITF